MSQASFPHWPSFSQEEAEKVKEVLLSNKVNYWTGTEGQEFEKEFAKWSDSNHAIALSNGTVALDVAIKCLDIGIGDEVIVTSRTFIASVSSIVTAGAKPIFADVDLNSQNITPETIEKVITPRTKAIICVHLAGWPCDMDGIMALSNKHNLFVIEDCAQAHGAKYKGKSVGSIGHIGAWSFCQEKIITTGGEGGMVTTNDEELWSKMWSFKDHGKDWKTVYEKEHPPGFRWLHDHFGTNGRMTEMQAAIGRIQLKRMPEWSEKRLKYATKIWETASKSKGLRTPVIPKHLRHAAYKCYIFIEPEELKAGWDRDRVMNAITKEGVPCFSGSCSEVYLERAFESTTFRPKERLKNAKELGETSLMFLVHPTLTNENIKSTINAIEKTMKECAL